MKQVCWDQVPSKVEPLLPSESRLEEGLSPPSGVYSSGQMCKQCLKSDTGLNLALFPYQLVTQAKQLYFPEQYHQPHRVVLKITWDSDRRHLQWSWAPRNTLDRRSVWFTPVTAVHHQSKVVFWKLEPMASKYIVVNIYWVISPAWKSPNWIQQYLTQSATPCSLHSSVLQTLSFFFFFPNTFLGMIQSQTAPHGGPVR